jgi:hypothetical protein
VLNNKKGCFENTRFSITASAASFMIGFLICRTGIIALIMQKSWKIKVNSDLPHAFI